MQKVNLLKIKGETLEEAKKINLSLTCLATVINSLTTNKDHIPYEPPIHHLKDYLR